jgi:hypothetical protein
MVFVMKCQQLTTLSFRNLLRMRAWLFQWHLGVHGDGL